MKHKALLLLLLLSTSIMVFGQDSVMIKQTCEKIHTLKNNGNINSQLDIYSKQLKANYLSSYGKFEKENIKQAFYRFNYKFIRELKRNCQECIIPITITRDYLSDIEGLFNKKEVDSLEHTLMNVSSEKKIYIQIITIDDFYPYNSIEDFGKNYRAVWPDKTIFSDRNILIVLICKQKHVRISTSESVMNLLTDEACIEVNNLMTPYFKRGKYFEGLMAGVRNMQTKL
jgi:hypothetical protein